MLAVEVVPGWMLKISAVFENVRMVFINVCAPTVGLDRVDVLKKGYF